MNLTIKQLFEMGEEAVGKTVIPVEGYGKWAFALTHKTTKTISLEGEYTITKPVKLYNEARGKKPASYSFTVKDENDFYSMFLELEKETNLKFK